MIKIYQKQTDDCLAACLASILHIKIEDVVNFDTPDDQDHEAWWLVKMILFLKKYNLAPVTFWTGDKKVAENIVAHARYKHYIVVTKTPLGHHHAVVARKGKIIHDPYPEQFTGLEEKYGIAFYGINKRF